MLCDKSVAEKIKILYNRDICNFAIYVGYGKVIHFAPEIINGKSENCYIHKADFSEFILTETMYEIIHFPEDGTDPIYECVDLTNDGVHSLYRKTDIFANLKAMLRIIKSYHIYSAQETAERAKSRLGEDKYNLAFNNCEHFAIWCKTGIKESSQVDEFLNVFAPRKTKISDNCTEKKKNAILA